jgi:hypothetical protein
MFSFSLLTAMTDLTIFGADVYSLQNCSNLMYNCRTFMLKLSRRGVAPPRSHTQGQLLVPLWKLSKRREVRSLKFVMLLERLLCGT